MSALSAPKILTRCLLQSTNCALADFVLAEKTLLVSTLSLPVSLLPKSEKNTEIIALSILINAFIGYIFPIFLKMHSSSSFSDSTFFVQLL